MFWLPVSHQTIKFGFMSQNKTQGFFQRFQFLLPQQKRGVPSGFWRVSTQQPTRKKNTIKQKKNMQQDAMLYTSWYIYKNQSSNHHQIRWCSSPHLSPSPPIPPRRGAQQMRHHLWPAVHGGQVQGRFALVRLENQVAAVPRKSSTGTKDGGEMGDKLPKNMRIWRLDEFRSYLASKTWSFTEIRTYIYTYIYICI